MSAATPQGRAHRTMDQRLLQAHRALQRWVLTWACLPTVLFFAVTGVLDPVWHNWVQLAAICTMIAIWAHAFRVASRPEGLFSSVYWFTLSAVGYEAVSMTVTEGNTASALLACLCAVIYASLFSNTHMLVVLVATFAALLLDLVTGYTQPFAPYRLTGGHRAVFEGFFFLVLLPVTAYVLRWSFALKDSLIHDVNALAEHQGRIIAATGQVHGDLEHVTADLERVTTALHGQATEQATSVSQTGAAIQHIARIADAHAATAQQVAQQGRRLADEATNAHVKLTTATDAFNQVIGRNEDVRADFEELRREAAHIDAIVRLNQDIAARINILSINAAIAAAKSGGANAGFHVVATELKSMISQTQRQLEESALILESIREKIEKNAHQVDANTAALETQFQTLDDIRKAVREFAQLAQDMVRRTEHIADGAGEQRTGIDEVRAAMADIDRAAQQLSEKTEVLHAQAARITRSQQAIATVLVQAPEPGARVS